MRKRRRRRRKTIKVRRRRRKGRKTIEMRRRKTLEGGKIIKLWSYLFKLFVL